MNTELTHWWIRGSSSATEPESIDLLEPQKLLPAYWSVGFRILCGHNQHVISLAGSRNPGSIGRLEPITIARCFLHEFDWSVNFRNLWGHNQLVISLADLQVHLNRWRGSANYRRSFSRTPDLLVSQNPKVVRRQPGSSLIGGNRGPSSTSESESIDKTGPLELQAAYWCVSLKLGCGGTTSS